MNDPDASSTGMVLEMLGGLGTFMLAGLGYLHVRINSLSVRMDEERRELDRSMQASAAEAVTGDNRIWTELKAMRDADTTFRVTILDKIGQIQATMVDKADLREVRAAIEAARSAKAGGND